MQSSTPGVEALGLATTSTLHTYVLMDVRVERSVLPEPAHANALKASLSTAFHAASSSLQCLLLFS